MLDNDDIRALAQLLEGRDGCCCPPNEDVDQSPTWIVPFPEGSEPLPREVQIASLELSSEGISTWEISVFELSAVVTLDPGPPPQTLTATTPIPLVEQPSAQLRLAIEPHGSRQTWLHDGRGTAIVTATGVNVRALVARGSVQQAAANFSADVTELSLTALQAMLKVTGTPARSRTHTKIQIGETFFLAPGEPFVSSVFFPLMPGCSEVWFDASYDNARTFGDDAIAFVGAIELAPRTWTPAEATREGSILLTGITPATVRYEQRTWI